VKEHISWVHTLVKARGKKASRTFFPRSLESVMSTPAVEGSVKSGAGVAAAGREAIG
jgi:hypothetical protein